MRAVIYLESFKSHKLRVVQRFLRFCQLLLKSKKVVVFWGVRNEIGESSGVHTTHRSVIIRYTRLVMFVCFFKENCKYILSQEKA